MNIRLDEGGDLGQVEASATDLVTDFRRARRTIATAESLTGGLLGSLITSVPGASLVYRGGVIAYSAETKMSVLGVSREACSYGLVSEKVAVEMAEGVHRLLDVDVAVSCTGVAGPDWDNSGPDPVPPGTVWLATASKWGSTTQLLTVTGSRQQIRLVTAHKALQMLAQYLLRQSGQG